MELQRANWVLSPEVRSIAHARTQIAERLIDWPDEPVEVVLLLASELVTNAAPRHGPGGPAPGLGRRLCPGGGSGPVTTVPVGRAADRDSLNVRGLFLVDGLSSGWRARPGATDKTVWFTMDA